MNVSKEISLHMIKVSTPQSLFFSGHESTEELADFLQQDEQKILQKIETELNQLIREPSEAVIAKILAYASLL